MSNSSRSQCYDPLCELHHPETAMKATDALSAALAQAQTNFNLYCDRDAKWREAKERVRVLEEALRLIERIDSNTANENMEDSLPSVGDVCEQAFTKSKE